MTPREQSKDTIDIYMEAFENGEIGYRELMLRLDELRQIKGSDHTTQISAHLATRARLTVMKVIWGCGTYDELINKALDTFEFHTD